jgi:hypothetical protein
VCVCLCPFMVATAYVSAQSAVDVKQVIRVRRCVCVCLSVSADAIYFRGIALGHLA